MEVSLVLIDSKSRVTMIDSLAGNRQQQNTDRMIAAAPGAAPSEAPASTPVCCTNAAECPSLQ